MLRVSTHQRLADRDDRDDGDARGDAVEGARGVVAVDQRAEEDHRGDDQEQEAELADLLGTDALLEPVHAGTA